MWYELAREYPALSVEVQEEVFGYKGKRIKVSPGCQAEIWKMFSSCLLFLFPASPFSLWS